MLKELLKEIIADSFGNDVSNQYPTSKAKKENYPTHSPLYKDAKMTEFICTHCGIKMSRHSDCGRPSPGRCPRRTGGRPHVWRINRKY